MRVVEEMEAHLFHNNMQMSFILTRTVQSSWNTCRFDFFFIVNLIIHGSEILLDIPKAYVQVNCSLLQKMHLTF